MVSCTMTFELTITIIIRLSFRLNHYLCRTRCRIVCLSIVCSVITGKSIFPIKKSMCTAYSTVQGNQSCSRFGNDLIQTTAVASGLRSGTFVNVSPAISCPGNATQWNICYYRSTSAMGTSTTLFAVYRLISGTTYNLITASQTTFTIARTALTYDCRHINVTAQYVVQPGDILVVCVQSGGAQLGVAGIASTSILLDSTSCNTLDPTIDTSTGYTLQSGLTVHVSLGEVLVLLHKLCIHRPALQMLMNVQLSTEGVSRCVLTSLWATTAAATLVTALMQT